MDQEWKPIDVKAAPSNGQSPALENEHSGKHMFVLTPENKRVAIGVKIDILIHFENLLHRQGLG
jgi:hypothetical protein